MASSRVPVHITSMDKAEGVYQKHAGGTLLGVRARGHMISFSCFREIHQPPACCLQVPLGGSERMRRFPALVAQDIRLEGGGYLEAAADITLSSAGKHVLHHPGGRSLLGSEASMQLHKHPLFTGNQR